MARIVNRSSSNPAPYRLEPSATVRSVSPRAPSPIVEHITRLDTGGHWVVSCYLKLEPRDRARGKYAIKLKNRIREKVDWVNQQALERGEREQITRDLARVRDYLDQPGNLPPGRGVAIFCSGAAGLFEAIALPQVYRSRLAVDRTPLIRELAALDDEFGLVLCAVYDRTSARFFKVTAFGVEELPRLVAEDATRTSRFHGSGGAQRLGPGMAAAGEHNFNQRIRVEKQRHYAQIARRLFEMARDGVVRGVVLAGTGAEAGAVRRHLHPYIEKLVLGVARLTPKTVTPSDVTDAVLEVRHEAERQWEADHVRALQEGVATGWAENGVEQTLRALSRGQVRVLLVAPDVASPGWRCASGRLTTVSGGCDSEGTGTWVPDVVDEAIEEALRQGSHIDVIESQELRGAVDGLAALLRFR